MSKKFSADEVVEDNRVNISGRIFDSVTQKHIEGAVVTVKSTEPDLNTEPSQSGITVTTDSFGGFGVTLPNGNFDLIYIEKEGYFDINGSLNIDSTTSQPKEVVFSLTLDPGFGVQYAHIQTIMPGDNYISTPLVLDDSNPKTFLSYYDTNPTSADGFTKRSIPPFLTRWNSAENQYVAYSKENAEIFGKINPQTGYILNFKNVETETGKTVVMKGNILEDGDGSISLGNTGKSLIGFPIIQKIRLRDMGARINGESVPIAEAMSSGVITQFIGWDVKEQKSVSFTKDNLDAEIYPGISYWVESTSDLVYLIFGASGSNPNKIEIPAEVSMEDAQWALNVDRTTFDDESFLRWQRINKKLQEHVDNLLLNQSGDLAEQKLDRHYLSFSKNGKTLTSPPQDSLGTKESKVKLASTGFACNAYKSMDYCHNIVDWEKDMLAPPSFLEQFNSLFNYVAPEIEKITGTEPLGQWRGKMYITIREVGDSSISGQYDCWSDVLWLDDDVFKNDSGAYEWDLSKHPDIKALIVHELTHAWFGELAPEVALRIVAFNQIYFSWIEGLTEYTAYLVCKNKGIGTDEVENYEAFLKYPRAGTKQFLYTKGHASWDNSKNFLRYHYATSSIEQMYSINHGVLTYLFNELFDGTQFNSIYSNLRVKIPQMGFESFDKWYSYQWGGLSQPNPKEFKQLASKPPYSNKKIGINPWAFAYEAKVRSDNKYATELRIQLVEIVDGDGNLKYRPFKYESTVYKTTESGGITNTFKKGVYRGYSGGFTFTHRAVDSYTEINLAEKANLEPGRKFTIVNKFIDLNNPGSTTGKKFFVNEYFAQPNENAGIYGVVAERRNEGEVWITPMRAPLSKQPVPIQYGYFQSTDPNLGYNEGSYKVSYQGKDGKWRHYCINKTEGQRFIAITTARNLGTDSDCMTDSTTAKLELTNKAQAADSWPEALTIDKNLVKKEIQSDGSVKVNFPTSRPSFSQIEWGLSAEYDQSTEFSEVPLPSEEDPDMLHELSLFSLVPGQTYHANIVAVDMSGISELSGNDALSLEEEEGEPTESGESGNFTITPFAISNIESMVGSNKATINWKSSVPTKGKICYGETTDYGTCTELSEISTDHSTNISNLKSTTTYNFQIIAETEDNTIRSSENNTFRTVSDEIKIEPYSGQWLGNYKGEITFNTDRLVKATIKWGKEGTTGWNTYDFIDASTSFRHQFDVDDESHYSYQIVVETPPNPDNPTSPILSNSCNGSFDTPAVEIQSVNITRESGDIRISWTTNIPAQGKAIYNCLADTYCSPFETPPEKIVSEYSTSLSVLIPKSEFLAYDAIHSIEYFASISAWGKSGNVKNALNQNFFFTPMRISSQSVTKRLVDTATQSWDVTFTWRTSLPATGSVVYSGFLSDGTAVRATVRCDVSNTTCTAIAHDVKPAPSDYHFTIRANATEGGWAEQTYDGIFHISPIDTKFIATYTNRGGTYGDEITNDTAIFDFRTLPNNFQIRSGTLSGKAVIWTYENGQAIRHEACPTSIAFSGMSPISNITLPVTCAGEYLFTGTVEAFDYDQGKTIQAPVEFAYTECASSPPYGVLCTYTDASNSYDIVSRRYLTPGFSGFEVEFNKPIAFPERFSSSDFGPDLFYFGYVPGDNGPDYHSAVGAMAPVIPLETAPSKIIRYDRINLYDMSLNSVPRYIRSGETVYGPNLPNCPGTVSYSVPGGEIPVWEDGYYPACVFTWP